MNTKQTKNNLNKIMVLPQIKPGIPRILFGLWVTTRRRRARWLELAGKHSLINEMGIRRRRS